MHSQVAGRVIDSRPTSMIYRRRRLSRVSCPQISRCFCCGCSCSCPSSRCCCDTATLVRMLKSIKLGGHGVSKGVNATITANRRQHFPFARSASSQQESDKSSARFDQNVLTDGQNCRSSFARTARRAIRFSSEDQSAGPT